MTRYVALLRDPVPLGGRCPMCGRVMDQSGRRPLRPRIRARRFEAVLDHAWNRRAPLWLDEDDA
jgi:hypothetical protein